MMQGIKDVCPCCNKDISLELEIIPFSQPTKTICHECRRNY